MDKSEKRHIGFMFGLGSIWFLSVVAVFNTPLFFALPGAIFGGLSIKYLYSSLPDKEQKQ